MRVLFVDDEVERFKEYTWNNPRWETDYARDVLHARRLIETFTYDVMMLDHDLSETGPDGTDLARIIIGLPNIRKYDASIICHSINADGRMRMVRMFLDAEFPNVISCPFAWKQTIYGNPKK